MDRERRFVTIPDILIAVGLVMAAAATFDWPGGGL